MYGPFFLTKKKPKRKKRKVFCSPGLRADTFMPASRLKHALLLVFTSPYYSLLPLITTHTIPGLRADTFIPASKLKLPAYFPFFFLWSMRTHILPLLYSLLLLALLVLFTTHIPILASALRTRVLWSLGDALSSL